jgi:hypothetical protein
MSSAGTRLAPRAETTTRERNALAYLIHALNQPLTGLQCSLELATRAPRRAEQYVRTLREGLELTARMRALVEALHELVESPASESDQTQPFELNKLLRDAVDDLLPVARQKRVEISLSAEDTIEVDTDRRHLAALTFRLLDSALSLASSESEMRITTRPDGACACLIVSWTPGPVPAHSPFSRPELGLLVARAGWEQASAKWHSLADAGTQTCTIHLPLRRVAGGATQESSLRPIPALHTGDPA